MTLDVTAAFLLLFGGHWLLLRRFVLPDLPASGKRLLIVLYAIHFVLIALYYASRSWGGFWSWYFDYRFSETTPPASYAASLYVMVALGAWLIAALGHSLTWPMRLFWLGTGAFLGYLGADEYFSLHEEMRNWTLYYVIAAGIMTLAGIVLLRHNRRDQRVLIMLVGGLGIAAVGGVVLEMLARMDCMGYLRDPCNRLPLIEEALENVGILTVLLGMILYANEVIGQNFRARVQKIITTGGAVAAAVLVTIPWVIPRLESGLIAEPVVIEYLDGDLSVLSYRVSQTVLRPGDTLDVQVYWRVNRPVDDPDGLSAHLVSRADGESFARVNHIVQEPRFRQAAPGSVYSSHLRLHLPPDIPAQTSYWLTLTAWQDRRPRFTMQPVSHTDRELLADDMAALRSLPVVDDSPLPLVDHPVQYDFQGDLSLTGYSAQADRNHLSLQFTWENRAAVPQPLIQFLHIFDSDGNYVHSQDRPPLGDSFPTTDWPAGMRAFADWQVDLPDDLPPGDYSLRTGLYESASGDRWTVQNQDGVPLQDHIIELGTIRLEG